MARNQCRSGSKTSNQRIWAQKVSKAGVAAKPETIYKKVDYKP
jgi:hypothetical protein